MQQNNRSVLVVGATGTVGSEVARALQSEGARVRALVRNPAAAKRLASVEVIPGDLRDVTAVRSALRGVQSAFYVSPHESDEEALGEQFISECERARVRLVYVGVHVPGPNRVARAVSRWVSGWIFPHYKPKFRIAERARVSKANPVVLMPTNYFQNDEMFRTQIEGGLYSQPFQRPINRVDVRDVGRAAARACLDLNLPSGAYPVVGPESLDALACSRAWSLALEREVVPAHPDVDAFDQVLRQHLHSAKKLSDFRASYRLIRKFTLPTAANELKQTTALLGRPPIAYATYVREVAAGVRAKVA